MKILGHIADHISGGALSQWRAMYRLADSRAMNAEWQVLLLSDQLKIARDQLRRIAANETTSANATVRRMAQLARENLE